MLEPLADRIRSALVQAGISQYKLAIFAGLNPQTVSRYLSGQTWSATTERKLERALARLPKRKSTKHRRINPEEGNHGKA
jgi:transcriptional regulator with XRE-family HTH domain